MSWWEDIDAEDALDVLTGIGSLFDFKSDKEDAKRAQRQAEYEADVMRRNALLAEYSALETLHEGRDKALAIKVAGREMLGQARVALGASGTKGGDSNLLLRDIYTGVHKEQTKVANRHWRRSELLNWEADMLRMNANMHERFGKPSGLTGVGSLLKAADSFGRALFSDRDRF